MAHALCYFVSDLHGNPEKYHRLFSQIRQFPPQLVLLGGDLLPPWNPYHQSSSLNFFLSFLKPQLVQLQSELSDRYPIIGLIMGNDDPRCFESSLHELVSLRLCHYLHQNHIQYQTFTIHGYNCIPPSPFLLKDWERYDISHYLDPDCIAPEDGILSFQPPNPIDPSATILEDLISLTENFEPANSIILFHAPPYQTKLDMVKRLHPYQDFAPLDPHIGSIAIRRWIEDHQPWLTLHGHAHESSQLSGSWYDKIGRTTMLTAASSSPDLPLIHFDLNSPKQAERSLL